MEEKPPVFSDPFSDDPPQSRTYVVLVSSTDLDSVEQKILEIDGVLSVVMQ
jgi:hypothetical protein